LSESSQVRDKQSVICILRDKIISGEFTAGERLAEIPTAERLGVSRTPIRIALRALESEGLLEKLPRRGYCVRNITLPQISDSVQVRGVLEGLAARQAAEAGITDTMKNDLLLCISAGDKIFEKGYLKEQDIEKYQKMNIQFHQLIISASNNSAINAALALSEHLPFASVNALAFNPDDMKKEYKRLYYAQLQHHAIFEALIHGQGARAEGLMKEHAQATLAYSKAFDTKSISNL